MQIISDLLAFRIMELIIEETYTFSFDGHDVVKYRGR